MDADFSGTICFLSSRKRFLGQTKINIVLKNSGLLFLWFFENGQEKKTSGEKNNDLMPNKTI